MFALVIAGAMITSAAIVNSDVMAKRSGNNNDGEI
jgi:hypothetical protein